jgi:hypothetical protein
LSLIPAQISEISSIPLSYGEKIREDVRAFFDEGLKEMELKSRKRPVKKAK